MIKEQDLREAIAECEGIRNPNSNTCIKLAAYYTILNNLYPSKSEMSMPIPEPVYSYENKSEGVKFGDSEFSQAVEVVGIDRAYPIIDELMETLLVLNPSLYHSVIRKLNEL